MPDISALPPHLQQRLRDELKPGEVVAWTGQPNAARFMKQGFVLWLFFIPWTGFSLFWMAAASNFKIPTFDSGPGWFHFFGLPFVLIGIAGLSAPLWLWRKAGSTIYAVTDQRALTLEGAKSIRVKSYAAASLEKVEKTLHQDGSGDLVLRTEQYRDSDGDQRTNKEGFFAIDDVRQVERLIEQLASPQSTFAGTTF